MYAMCALAKITKLQYQEWKRPKQKRSWRGCSQTELADQYTKFVFVLLLKAKNEILASLKNTVLSVGTPKKLRQDNAKEFLSEQFRINCLDARILQEKSIPETPQQNGLA